MKKSALETIYEICEESGATHPVGHDFYNDFINMNNEDMAFYIKAIIFNRAEEINEIVFSQGETENDEKIHELFTLWLRYMAIGLVGINDDEKLVFTQPIGEPPTKKQEIKIEEKINNAKPLIKKVIIEWLKKEREFRDLENCLNIFNSTIKGFSDCLAGCKLVMEMPLTSLNSSLLKTIWLFR